MVDSIPPIRGGGAPAPASGGDQIPPSMMNSPFVKMFEKTGAVPTMKQLQQIINGILKEQINAIKKSDASWKAAMRKMKDAIEGNGDS